MIFEDSFDIHNLFYPSVTNVIAKGCVISIENTAIHYVIILARSSHICIVDLNVAHYHGIP